MNFHNESARMFRRYDLDWLRVIAFTLLILFHTGMYFCTWEWHVKNPVTSDVFDVIMAFLHQWRIPLLFFISGAVVWFAMDKYSMLKFIGERHTRLLIPLVFGIFFIIPPQVYHERLFQGQVFDSFFDFYKTVLQFVPYEEGNFSWHHLWYIPYIFVYSLLALPLFCFLKSNTGKIMINRMFVFFENKYKILWWFIPLGISESSLRPFWPDNENNLIGDWSQFSTMLILFVIGYLMASQKNIWNTIMNMRYKTLITGGITMSILYYLWNMDYELSAVEYIFYRFFRMFNLWCWLLTILGFGKYYLSFNSRFLKYANEAVYPFYIVHQTVTVIIGFYIVNWDVNIPLKFLVLVAGTFGGSWLIYELVKRNNLTRIVFGLKWKSKNNKVKSFETQNSLVSLSSE